MSNQKVQNFKSCCPLTRLGLFGIQEHHQIPNIPCDRSSNDVFLNQHLQWYHNFDSGSARKLVRAIFDNTDPNEHIFSIDESILKQNVAVEGYKCRCPLIHDGIYGLTDEHDVTNVPCGRADKEVLCFQHLQYHHNLCSRAAKKIVLALISFTPTTTLLFHSDDLVTQSKCGVRKLKGKCPLLARHLYGLVDHHRVPNIPCDRADQDIFLFHHLTYFHKLTPKAATKLIRAMLLHKSPSEPLFHYNDIIVESGPKSFNQNVRRSKKFDNEKETLNRLGNLNQSRKNPFEHLAASPMSDLRSKNTSFINPIHTSTLPTFVHKTAYTKCDNNSIPLDCSLHKQEPYEMLSYNDTTHGTTRDREVFFKFN